jgi:hypothetical protein
MSLLIGQAVRRAVLDLICCPVPKKLLVLLRVHMTNVEIVLKRSGSSHPRLPEDIAIIGSIDLGAVQFAAGTG